MHAVWAAAPFLAALMFAVILGGVGGNLAQSGLIFTADKVKPKWSKVNPLEGFKRIFGPDGLVQFLKTFIKLVAIGAVCWWVLKPHARELENLAAMSPAMILPFARDLALALMLSALIFLSLTAGADYLWQRMRFAKRMRMTKEELKEDFKQSDGDPHVKAKLRQIRMQRGRQRMMQAVPDATVIITNPTHYSVALRYEPDQGDGAPVCVAKGVDEMAARIRECAATAGVPIRSDPPAARALYASVDIGGEILPEYYARVAAAIRFAETMRGKARRAWR